MSALPFVQGSGVEGYLTTHWYNSLLKSHFFNFSSHTDVISIIGASTPIAGIKSLFQGGTSEYEKSYSLFCSCASIFCFDATNNECSFLIFSSNVLSELSCRKV
jgi:hypothetical protein